MSFSNLGDSSEILTYCPMQPQPLDVSTQNMVALVVEQTAKRNIVIIENCRNFTFLNLKLLQFIFYYIKMLNISEALVHLRDCNPSCFKDCRLSYCPMFHGHL